MNRIMFDWELNLYFSKDERNYYKELAKQSIFHLIHN